MLNLKLAPQHLQARDLFLLMAKFKAAGSSKAAAKKDARSNLRALPCLIIILAGAALLSFLFFAALTADK